jgi:hypothetical protein
MIETIPTKLKFETVEVGTDDLKYIIDSIKELKHGPPLSNNVVTPQELFSHMDTVSKSIDKLSLSNEAIAEVKGLSKDFHRLLDKKK